VLSNKTIKSQELLYLQCPPKLLENGLCLVQGGRLEGRCGIYGANAVGGLAGGAAL